MIGFGGWEGENPPTIFGFAVLFWMIEQGKGKLVVLKVAVEIG
jgi:hypothetical protein